MCKSVEEEQETDCELGVQVKVRNWIAGLEEPEVVGVGAKFGELITDFEQDHSAPLAKLDPEDACTDSIKPVSSDDLGVSGIYLDSLRGFYYMIACNSECKEFSPQLHNRNSIQETMHWILLITFRVVARRVIMSNLAAQRMFIV